VRDGGTLAHPKHTDSDHYTPVTMAGTPVRERYYHGLAVARCHDELRVYIFGGRNVETRMSDMYSFPLAGVLAGLQ